MFKLRAEAQTPKRAGHRKAQWQEHPGGDNIITDDMNASRWVSANNK